MEKRHLVLHVLLCLLFQLFYNINLVGQCASTAPSSLNYLMGGGIMIVGTGEGENLDPLPGDIYFSYTDECQAILRIAFRVANLVDTGEGYVFPLDENEEPTPDIVLELNINGNITYLNTSAGPFVPCQDYSNIFYWETEVAYAINEVCQWSTPYLDVNISFQDAFGNPYNVSQYSSPGEIF